jgi:ankyrin repeat protein
VPFCIKVGIRNANSLLFFTFLYRQVFGNLSSLVSGVDIHMRILVLSAFALNAVRAGMTVEEFKTAYETNSSAMVRQWIAEGKNVDAPINLLGDTCLMEAAGENFINLFALLVDSGANVNAVNKRGITACMIASSVYPSADIVTALIRASADVNTVQTVNTPFRHYSNALMKAMGLEQFVFMRLLLDAGAVVTDWMMLWGVNRVCSQRRRIA